MNKTKIIGSILAVAVVAALVFTFSTHPAQNAGEKQVIKIGISGPLSGSLAFMGEGMRNGANLAIKQFVEENPNSKFSYEIAYEDDGFDPKRTASALTKLTSVDKVNALMTVASAAGNIAAPIAEKNGVPHFGIASDPNIAKGDYNFLHWTPPFEEAKVFIAALKERNIHKIVIFGANIQGITAVIDEIEKQAQGTDIEIVDKEIFNFGTTDFRTLISKAKAMNAEMYVPIAFSPELEILVKQMRDAKITEMTSVEAFELTEKLSLFEGKWYVNAADSSQKFRDDYKAAYGIEPVAATANAYDIVKMIIAASEKAGQNKKVITNTDIKDALYGVNFDGALGHLSINEDGFVLSKAVVRIIKDGKPVTISK